MSVIHNTQSPERMMKKKSNSILLACYTRGGGHEQMPNRMHISMHENPADLATKMLPGGQK